MCLYLLCDECDVSVDLPPTPIPHTIDLPCSIDAQHNTQILGHLAEIQRQGLDEGRVIRI